MKHATGKAWGVAGRIFLGIIGMGWCAVIIYPIFATGSGGHHRSCMSNLKRQGTVIAIYQSDFDDKVPPFFTFCGSDQAKKFIAATIAYGKNEQIYLCPQDTKSGGEHSEGLKSKMSYVHCLSLRGAIPNYNLGNRSFALALDSKDASTTPYLRDPIRGFGTSDVKYGESSDPAFLSPHGALFFVLYLDTHVKVKKPISEFTEL